MLILTLSQIVKYRQIQVNLAVRYRIQLSDYIFVNVTRTAQIFQETYTILAGRSHPRLATNQTTPIEKPSPAGNTTFAV